LVFLRVLRIATENRGVAGSIPALAIFSSCRV